MEDSVSEKWYIFGSGGKKKTCGAILSCYIALNYRWLVLFLNRTCSFHSVVPVIVPATHELVPLARSLIQGLWIMCVNKIDSDPSASKTVTKQFLCFGWPDVYLNPYPAVAVWYLAEWNEILVGIDSQVPLYYCYLLFTLIVRAEFTL